MSIFHRSTPISIKISTRREQRRFALWLACVLATLLLCTLTGTLAAQSPTPVATPSEIGTPTTVATPTPTVPTPMHTAEVVVQPVLALLPQPPLVDTEQVKALIRSRILALIRTRLTLSATEQSAAYTVTLPLVLGGATMLQQTEVNSDTLAAVVTASATETPPLPTETPVPTPTPEATPQPAPTPDGNVRTARVPILMYHYLSEPPPGADIYRRDLSVTPARFAEHLDRLRAEGYTPIRLDDLLLNLTQGTPLPDKPVILTFDDGYRDNYVNAFPLLRERGMTATFFIVTDFIDQQRPEYLSWDMVREMYAGGMAIESHGRNHADLASRDDDYLIWQALGSMETIQYELGVRPRFVSYPAGDYDENTIRIFQSANYWAGVTTQQGATHSADNLFELRRVRVRGTTTADDLAQLLAVDW